MANPLKNPDWNKWICLPFRWNGAQRANFTIPNRDWPNKGTQPTPRVSIPDLSRKDTLPPGDDKKIFRSKYYASGQLDPTVRPDITGNQKHSFRTAFLSGQTQDGGDETEWPLGEFNRLRLFVKWKGFVRHDATDPYDVFDESTLYEGSCTTNTRADITFGTYSKPPGVVDNSEFTNFEWTDEAADTHLYHCTSLAGPDIWQQVIFDRQPGTARTKVNANEPFMVGMYPTSAPTAGHFDCLCKWYWNVSRDSRVQGDYAELFIDGPEMFTEDMTYYTYELERRANSLAATHVTNRASGASIDCFVGTLRNGGDEPEGHPYPTGVDERYTIEVRVSPTSTFTGTPFNPDTNGWSSATFVRTIYNVLGPLGSGDSYKNIRFQLPTTLFADHGNPSGLFIAYKIVSHPSFDNATIDSWGHREIAVMRDNDVRPPFPGGVMP